ncbi:SAM-dependent methyltransferase [Jeotgalibacillus aurantiacus]|uniref:SAM-dependent methyltransferase n=1 Tax=Jeotgalibacillus aurantiacus TaxID=2763266 RepID=UPI001D09B067|nr:class I SAM-dependent methyltransferase [Jeotgalibacillus aurantiacus]
MNDYKLRIKTGDLLELVSSSSHHNRYEATPYEALEALAEEMDLHDAAGIVDYGCGKGRVSFYLHHRFGVNVTGIELNPRLYQMALENQASYLRKFGKRRGSIQFERGLAEDYEVRNDQSLFYFFNPFSVQLFSSVVSRIMASVSQSPRKVSIILYYPTMEYLDFLGDQTPFQLKKELKIPILSEQNEHERFMIYDYHPISD